MCWASVQSDSTGPISQLFSRASHFVFLLLACLCGQDVNAQESLHCQRRAMLLHSSSQTPNHALSPRSGTLPHQARRGTDLLSQTFLLIQSSPGAGTACLHTIEVSRSSPFRIPDREARPLLRQVSHSWKADGEELRGLSS